MDPHRFLNTEPDPLFNNGFLLNRNKDLVSDSVGTIGRIVSKLVSWDTLRRRQSAS
jgi:hypothetical protein